MQSNESLTESNDTFLVRWGVFVHNVKCKAHTEVLGLGHNKKTDVMYAESSWVTKLSENDKASYDKAYKKY